MRQKIVWPDANALRPETPDPQGYRLLIALPGIEQKTDGGLILPDEVRDAAKRISSVGKVIKVGSACYDDAKFKGEAWAREGDNVVIAPYAGVALTKTLDGVTYELRIINDDEVLGIHGERADGWV